MTARWMAACAITLLGLLANACTTLQPAAPSDADLVGQWNELALTALRADAFNRPTVASRQLFLLHAAMYDAWSALDPKAKPYALDPAIKLANPAAKAAKIAAVSQAAFQILRREFKRVEGKSGIFKNQMVRLGLPILDVGDRDTPDGVGFLAAQAVLAKRANDGANAAGGYAQTVSALYPRLYAPVNGDDPRAARAPGHAGFDPNHWQPLRTPYPSTPKSPGGYAIDQDDRTTYDIQLFTTPHWGAVQPFAMASGAEFRPPPPPQLGSNAAYTDATGKQTSHDQAYRDQVAEVLRLSAELSDRDKAIVEYWADALRTETPAGHWNLIARGISARDQHSLDDDVKMYFALNGALLDAGIATWDAKRHYDYVRPVSAIHHLYYDRQIHGWGGRNRGVQTIFGQDWQPYQQQILVTPPFPEYVSGHSAFSAAAATVLALYSGSDRCFDGVTHLAVDTDRDGQPDLLGQYRFRKGKSFYESGPAADVVLRWDTLKEAADQAGYSRRLGGIHFQDGDLRGREMGRKIGELAFAKARSYWE
ncbi:MAG: vanadium-dependent haloperoxidase [Gammaproteobacteria bacterium]